MLKNKQKKIINNFYQFFDEVIYLMKISVHIIYVILHIKLS